MLRLLLQSESELNGTKILFIDVDIAPNEFGWADVIVCRLYNAHL